MLEFVSSETIVFAYLFYSAYEISQTRSTLSAVMRFFGHRREAR